MHVIAIDWSGAQRPAKKLWIATAFAGDLCRLEPLSSRLHAVDQVLQHVQLHPQSIIGLDFAFSMPAWFLRSHGLSTPFELWGLVRAEGEHWLRDCLPPFWGRRGKRRPVLDAHFRKTERLTEHIAGISPKSCFQISGGGAVGTGSIRGMPFLATLREAGLSVWPFDPPTMPLVVEIYPRLLTREVKKNSPKERDAYLGRSWPRLPDQYRIAASNSEDAFDAAVSALVMDRHRHEFEALSSGHDEFASLEGTIWAPGSA